MKILSYSQADETVKLWTLEECLCYMQTKNEREPTTINDMYLLSAARERYRMLRWKE